MKRRLKLVYLIKKRNIKNKSRDAHRKPENTRSLSKKMEISPIFSIDRRTPVQNSNRTN